MYNLLICSINLIGMFKIIFMFLYLHYILYGPSALWSNESIKTNRLYVCFTVYVHILKVLIFPPFSIYRPKNNHKMIFLGCRPIAVYTKLLITLLNYTKHISFENNLLALYRIRTIYGHQYSILFFKNCKCFINPNC